MSIKLKIYLGFLVVLVSGALTMTAGYPQIYSPYSFTVVIPVFMLYALALPGPLLLLLASLPNALFFLLSTRSTAYENLKISRLLTGISALLVSLSVIFLFVSYDYGVQYQGLHHTLFMYLFNGIFIFSLIATFIANNRKPSVNKSLVFRVLLFCWLGWCAFPWLGELM
jgi:hypothetical protein